MTQLTSADRRSGPDVASLLVELGRLLRACRFYGQGHATVADLFRRTVRAFQGEIERAGPLELHIEAGSFQFGGGRLLPHVLDELATELAARRLRSIRLGAPLDEDAFAALVQLASMDPEALARRGGPQRALHGWLVEGIEIEEEEVETLPDPGQAEPGARAGSTNVEPGSRAPSRATEQTDDEVLELGFAPDDTPLGNLILELEACEDNATYARLADRLVEAAQRAVRTGHPEEAYRAVLAARDHAGDELKRNAHQRRMASSMLHRLLCGPVLGEVLERACGDVPDASVEASGVLLQAGELSVPALLDRIDRSDEPLRRDRLRSVLIALGEAATQPLLEAIGGSDLRLARSAVRLCGELQHPASVQWLEDIVAGSQRGLRQEAVMALARIGGQSSLRALLRVLEGPEREVRILTVQALGASGRTEAVPPLAARLRRDLGGGDLELAHEAIRALGRLGGPQATPALAEVLDQRRWLGRARLRELKLAALTALGRIPGEEAARLLSRAARQGDRGLRRAAEASLRRRAAVDLRDGGG